MILTVLLCQIKGIESFPPIYWLLRAQSHNYARNTHDCLHHYRKSPAEGQSLGDGLHVLSVRFFFLRRSKKPFPQKKEKERERRMYKDKRKKKKSPQNQKFLIKVRVKNSDEPRRGVLCSAVQITQNMPNKTATNPGVACCAAQSK